jgi:hypothetical protein
MGKESALIPSSLYNGSNRDEADLNILFYKHFGPKEQIFMHDYLDSKFWYY